MASSPLQRPFEVDPEKHKELFSRAYIHAVISAAGYTAEFHNANDDHSVEVMIKARGGPGPKLSPRIEAQLKATSRPVFNKSGTHLHFPLKQKNYDDLRGDNSVANILLVVVLPFAVTDWLTCSPEAVRLCHCCYWISLAGMPTTHNRTKTVVRIPRDQLFTPDALDDMMLKRARLLPL